jgi:hypothetical protein
LANAISTVRRIGDARLIIVALRDIATENIQAGQIKRAAKAFKRGITIAESIQNAWSWARALAKMAITLHDFP